MAIHLGLQGIQRERKLTKDESTLKDEQPAFETGYQRWFTEARQVVAQLIPHRLDDFERLYRTDPKRKTVQLTNFSIHDWLIGMRASKNPYTGETPFDDLAAVIMRFKAQIDILDSATARFESSLLEIRHLLRADLLDDELAEARDLLRNGYSRAAGAVAGVVLEAHLAQVAASHAITLRKKDPTIGDWNDALRQGIFLASLNGNSFSGWRTYETCATIRSHVNLPPRRFRSL